jgi:hypothetical protein
MSPTPVTPLHALLLLLSPQAARVSRKAVTVRASSYHSNWRTQSVSVVQNNNNGNGANALVPKQMSQAARPLPAQPIARPTPGDLNNRYANVLKHFPSALGVDDFIARVEVALCYFGFTGDNTIGEALLPAVCFLHFRCALCCLPAAAGVCCRSCCLPASVLASWLHATTLCFAFPCTSLMNVLFTG